MKITIIATALSALLAGTVATAQPAGTRGDMSRAQFAARADQQFARIDANGDGTATAAELASRRQARPARANNVDRVARRFARMDADGNGAITLAEMRSAQARRGEGRGGKARGAGRLDADRNGTVTRAEFQARALTRFAGLDADRNGTVTQAERQSARQARRAR